jgi:hypothetical protein
VVCIPHVSKVWSKWVGVLFQEFKLVLLLLFKCYSPLCTLACNTIFLHFVQSLTVACLFLLIPVIFKSSSTLSLHLSHGLPLFCYFESDFINFPISKCSYIPHCSLCIYVTPTVDLCLIPNPKHPSSCEFNCSWRQGIRRHHSR